MRTRWPVSPSYTTSASVALAVATSMRRPSCSQLAGESMFSSGVAAVTNASRTTTCGTGWSRSNTSSASYWSGSRSATTGATEHAASGNSSNNGNRRSGRRDVMESSMRQGWPRIV